MLLLTLDVSLVGVTLSLMKYEIISLVLGIFGKSSILISEENLTGILKDLRRISDSYQNKTLSLWFCTKGPKIQRFEMFSDGFVIICIF